MKDEPHKQILNREMVESEIGKYFSESLGLIEDLVNYRTNLIPRCFGSSETELHDVVINISLLKQIQCPLMLHHQFPHGQAQRMFH